ncbi:Phosphatidylserine synthase 2 [Bonamia ostreae]|uniref:Phosphatidylserine synthase 2 n=1 Tax=Bonamia ostreae TaxID=126728 RepID=A0ABV2ATB2_9EUKA
MQLSPESWAKTEWHPLATIKRFVVVNLVAFGIFMVEVNVFALKSALKIPHDNILNIYRVVFWFMLGVPATRQCYFYLSDPNVTRFGTVASLAVVTLFVETATAIKFSLADLPAKIPTRSLVLWGVYILLYAVGCVVMFRKIKKS